MQSTGSDAMNFMSRLSFRGRLLFAGCCSAAYGLTLLFSAAVATGAGDGTYLPLNVFSSPLGIMAIPAGFYGLLPLWFLVGVLLAGVPNRSCRVAFAALMLAHYLGVVVTLAATSSIHWKRFFEFCRVWSPGILIVVGFAVYLIGQIFIWWFFRRSVRQLGHEVDSAEYPASAKRVVS